MLFLFNPHEDEEGQKSLATFSGLMLEKVTKVRRLIFKLCLPQDITIDLNPHYPPHYLQYIMLLIYCPKNEIKPIYSLKNRLVFGPYRPEKEICVLNENKVQI